MRNVFHRINLLQFRFAKKKDHRTAFISGLQAFRMQHLQTMFDCFWLVSIVVNKLPIWKTKPQSPQSDFFQETFAAAARVRSRKSLRGEVQKCLQGGTNWAVDLWKPLGRMTGQPTNQPPIKLLALKWGVGDWGGGRLTSQNLSPLRLCSNLTHEPMEQYPLFVLS